MQVVARLPRLTHGALTTHAVGVGQHEDLPLTACAQVCAGRAHTHIPDDVLRTGMARRTVKRRGMHRPAVSARRVHMTCIELGRLLCHTCVDAMTLLLGMQQIRGELVHSRLEVFIVTSAWLASALRFRRACCQALFWRQLYCLHVHCRRACCPGLPWQQLSCLHVLCSEWVPQVLCLAGCSSCLGARMPPWPVDYLCHLQQSLPGKFVTHAVWQTCVSIAMLAVMT
jgi:hypothetical protein